MPDDKTTVTELATAMGMTGATSTDQAIADRPSSLRVSNDVWDRVARLHASGLYVREFTVAFMNGREFLAAAAALRHRPPRVIEWTGGRKPPGDEVVPADLLVDHVYLVSCKYRSDIVINASPHYLFERLLAGPQGKRGGNWYDEVAPMEHAGLYESLRRSVDTELPERHHDLTAPQRKALAKLAKRKWPPAVEPFYLALVERTAAESARRWLDAIGTNPEALLWRLLRIGSAPYFVLGGSDNGFVRLRIATPWDWRAAFAVRSFAVETRPGKQAMVAWAADVRDLATNETRVVSGFIEVRWSHGRFCGPPEAKVHLETPFEDVPGYFPLQ